MPIGLFHFEFTAHPNPHSRARRRTLVNSANAYGSTQSLNRPLTMTSEDEQTLALSAEKRPHICSLTLNHDHDISPSPTYRTLDCRRMKRRPDHSLMLDEESILALSSSRQSTCTTATLSTLPLQLQLQYPVPAAGHPATRTSSLFTPSHLSARPLSNIPARPISFQLQLRELERLKAEHTAKTKLHAAMPPQSPTKASRPALYRTNSKSDLKSSCALPLASGGTPAGSMDFSAARAASASAPRPKSEVPEMPAPEWCPAALKERSPPLSADPAIRRLTDDKDKRASTITLTAAGGGGSRVSRRLSFSGFEFEFAGRARGAATGTARAVSAAVPVDSNSGSDANKDKNNNVARSESANAKQDKIMNRQTPLPRHRVMSVSAASTSTAIGAEAAVGVSVSLFPPAAAPPRPAPSGLAVSKTRAGHERKESTTAGGGSRKRGKSMVERGRYERLPR